jgi:hypothetical protein
MKPRAGIRKFALFAPASAFTLIPALSQTQAPAKKPSFEVVSVKPIGPGIVGGGAEFSGGPIHLSLSDAERLAETILQPFGTSR